MGQRCVKIAPEVLDVLDANTEAQQVVRDGGRFGGMPAAAFDQRLDTTQTGRVGPQADLRGNGLRPLGPP